MRKQSCENCGCAIGRYGCENCNEEAYILEQYYELDMPLPSQEFQDKAAEQKRKHATELRGLMG